MSLQRGRGPVQARSKADEGRATLKYIDVDDLVPSEDNFYSMSDIDELAGLIELSGGVKQPALVSPLGGGKYKVIAGHRRRLASLQLVEQGKEQYRKMPCMVDADEREPGADAEADELRAIDEAILLITTNGQREKTDWDKVQEATRLRILLDRKRQFEKIPGETRKLIAERLGTTPAQVGRYDSIEKHLLPRFKELLAEGKVNISVAYELSTLKEEEQCAALMDYLTTGALSIEDVKRRRKEMAEKEKMQAAAREGTAQTPATITTPEPAPVRDGDKVKLSGFGKADGAYTAKDAATPGKMTLERERPASGGADVLPEKLEDEDGAPKVKRTELPTVESAGKVVDFPAPPTPPPAPIPPGTQLERMSAKQAAFVLDGLMEYCETMVGADGENPETWIEYADALTVAIDALRK